MYFRNSVYCLSTCSLDLQSYIIVKLNRLIGSPDYSGYNPSCQMTIWKLKTGTIYLILAVALTVTIPACGTGNGVGSNDTTGITTAETEDLATEEPFDWSTITPDVLWQVVFELYESDGSRYALSFLDQGIENGIVTYNDADLVRAGFLFELGRLDEAFLRLTQYIINTDRPDLLRLRAEILWGICRYEDALRDYISLHEMDAEQPSPDILFAMARLYGDLGNWQDAREMRERLNSIDDSDHLSIRIEILDALRSEDLAKLEEALASSTGILIPADPLYVLVQIYIDYLGGNITAALDRARDFITDIGFDSNIALMLLRLEAEAGEYDAFRQNLRSMFEDLEAVQWLDASPDTYPSHVGKPFAVADLLDSASALVLGSGLRERARLLADRAVALNPYDYVAYLQLAAVDISEFKIESSFENLDKALNYAPPSDVRTRLRILQFSTLAGEGAEIPWDLEELTQDLDKLLIHYESEYPLNPFYKSARAELTGYEGDIDGAIALYIRALALPGATRETSFRLAYWLARDSRLDEAIEIVEISLPPGSPYLTWVTALEQEADLNSDPNLQEFASRVHAHLDPENSHAEFFNPVISE